MGFHLERETKSTFSKCSTVLLEKIKAVVGFLCVFVFVCGPTGFGPAAQLCLALVNLISQMDAWQSADCSFDLVCPPETHAVSRSVF